VPNELDYIKYLSLKNDSASCTAIALFYLKNDAHFFLIGKDGLFFLIFWVLNG
jgi:hypothetical protein